MDKWGKNMKIIATKAFKKLYSDLITHPPIMEEQESTPFFPKKKKKKIYQLNREVVDEDIENLR